MFWVLTNTKAEREKKGWREHNSRKRERMKYKGQKMKKGSFSVKACGTFFHKKDTEERKRNEERRHRRTHLDGLTERFIDR